MKFLKLSPKQMVIGAMAAAALVAIASLVDIVAEIPFGREMLLDVLFLISAGVVIYMGWDVYQDLS